MREIKFRAWDKVANDMLPNIQNHINDEIFAFGYMLNNYERFSIMQYTGLKDKNGKEIYEGDVLSHGNHKLLVAFIDGCFSFECRISKYTGISMSMRDHQESEFEVIGNQFETPQLVPELL